MVVDSDFAPINYHVIEINLELNFLAIGLVGSLKFFSGNSLIV